MTQEDKRSHRIGAMERAIFQATKKHGSCGKEKLIYAIMYEFKCSKRITLEYLKMIISTGRVDETAGILTWKQLI